MHIDDLNPSNHPTLLTRWIDHATRILRQIPNCRWYAFNAEQIRSLALVMATWWQREREKDPTAHFDDKQGQKFLTELLGFIPGSMQSWRPGEAPALPEIPIDPVTKQPMRNPHLEPVDLVSGSQLAKDMPELNEHLKEIAKAGGSSYARIKRLREAEDERKALQGVSYGGDDHRGNKFRDTTAALTQRMEFARQLGGENNPRYKIWKMEAETVPMLPWHAHDGRPKHFTAMGKIAKHSRELHDLVEQAAQVERAWIDHENDELKKVVEQHERKLQANAQLLATK